MSKQIQDLSVQELRQEIKRRLDKGNEPHGILVLKTKTKNVWGNVSLGRSVIERLNELKKAVCAKDVFVMGCDDEIFLITNEGIVKPEDKGLKITIERKEPDND